MLIYLMRHAKTKNSNNDKNRILSKNGIEEIYKVSEKLKLKTHNIKFIYHSFKLRAKETAQILAKQINFVKNIIPLKGLLPNDIIDPILYLLSKEEKNLMLVGHQPFMQALIYKLIQNSKTNDQFIFSTANIICIKKENKKYNFLWKLEP